MPATVKGGFFEQNGVGILNTIETTSPLRRNVAQLMARKSMRALRRAARTLNGVVAGSVATETQTRVDSAVELSGKRTIETETLISRATTGADVIDITADLFTMSTKTYNPTPPANLDGNPLGTR